METERIWSSKNPHCLILSHQMNSFNNMSRYTLQYYLPFYFSEITSLLTLILVLCALFQSLLPVLHAPLSASSVIFLHRSKICFNLHSTYIKVRRVRENSFCMSLHVQNTRTQVYEDRLFKLNADECTSYNSASYVHSSS